jgi:trimeric autotransporter adhesin
MNLFKSKMTIHLSSNSLCCAPLRHSFVLFPLVLAFAWFAPAPCARAVCQQGCDDPHSNTFLGENALLNNTSGFYNIAVGINALKFNTNGSYNTATGAFALDNNTSGAHNTAAGYEALQFNTTGSNNTATGEGTLYSNSTGSGNTAIGYYALSYSTGNDNTATGAFALYTTTTGGNNTAVGAHALEANTIGAFNSATGDQALYNNTSGSENTANGNGALASNTTGFNNTATGFEALVNNTTSSSNTATGSLALASNATGNSNTAIGASALFYNTSGGSNIAIGNTAGFNLTTGSNNIDIGNKGKAGESNYIRIGTKGTQTNTLIAGISGTTVAGGVGVIIDTNGHLGTVVSSERFKNEVKPMDKTSEAILSLKPVTFRYKHNLDPDSIPQFGLVAEQVEKVNPDLVVRDAQGKPYTVRYEAVNAMLLNEFLKEHKAFVEEQRRVQNQGATIARQQRQIDALIAGLQKVSAQLELSKPAPQTVVATH